MKKAFVLILFIVVLISYGQLLGMYVWQDDNGLFFKLAHVSERAGYLSAGPFGAGAYKYIVTPYILVYKFFGYNTVPYFFLALICYFLTAVVVYIVISEILGEKAGRVSAFLWAAGFIASDGFIRLFNTVVTSLSVVLISLLMLFYWRFLKEKRYRWYVLAVLSYFAATEFARGRTHYLISIVIGFELIFLTLRKPFVKSILYSLLRLVPFVMIFYYYFVVNADARAANVGKFLLSFVRGDYYQSYGFLSSVGNLVVPDWLTSRILQTKAGFIWLLAIVVFIFIILWIFRNYRRRKFVLPIILALFFAWAFVSRNIFLVPVLNLGQAQIFTAFLGGAIILLSVAYCLVVDNKIRNLYLFFLFWLYVNVGAYSAYNPTVAYETVNRYLAHSFFALVVLGGILYKANIKSKFLTTLIILWGVMNIAASVVYQNNIIKKRSIPPRNFYRQLLSYTPKIEKGDVFYFDVSGDARGYFADAFSVASMPETTAIAWRYGVDRYDFEMFTDFSKLVKAIVSKNIPPEKIHAFRYQSDGLIDTSAELRKLIFFKGGINDVKFENEGGALVFKEHVSSVAPVRMVFNISAVPKFVYGNSSRKLDNNFKDMAFEYLKFKNWVLSNASYSATSQWQDRTIANVHDKNSDTLWQPDRILWHDKKQGLTIDLGKEIEIDKFVWINGFGNNTPTKYIIETSLDGKSWQVVKSIDVVKRIDDRQPQVIKFDSRKTRFVRMGIVASLNDDSPGISEAWLVPSALSGLDIVEAEKFLQRPFDGVGSLADFNSLLGSLNYKGSAQIYWKKDKGNNWETQIGAKIDIFYDGKVHSYEAIIPAGGLALEKIKLSEIVIPGEIKIENVRVFY